MSQMALGSGAWSKGRPGFPGIDAADGADAGPFLGVHPRLQFVAQQPDLAGDGIVAQKQFAVAHNAAAETGAERDAEKIVVTLGAAGLFQQGVDVRQEAGDGFAINEQVAVIVEEDRNAELLFQHRTERNAAAESGQISQVADDAVGIIRRSWEREADGHGRLGALLFDAREAFDDVGQAAVQVVAVGGQGDCFGHGLMAAHGGKAEVGAAGVEGHDDAWVGV